METPEKNEETIVLKREYFEHLLACLANQKFIHDVNADGASLGIEKVRSIQREMQETIDKAWREGMDLIHTQKSSPPLPDNAETLQKAEKEMSIEELVCRLSISREALKEAHSIIDDLENGKYGINQYVERIKSLESAAKEMSEALEWIKEVSGYLKNDEISPDAINIQFRRMESKASEALDNYRKAVK